MPLPRAPTPARATPVRCAPPPADPGPRVVNLYPAIDILDGSAVRLQRGDFEQRTVYDADPLAAAASWAEQGAQRLHVVDLDGAKAGRPLSLDHLRRIVERTGLPVQYGGGLRTLQAIDEALAA